MTWVRLHAKTAHEVTSPSEIVQLLSIYGGGFNDYLPPSQLACMEQCSQPDSSTADTATIAACLRGAMFPLSVAANQGTSSYPGKPGSDVCCD